MGFLFVEVQLYEKITGKCNAMQIALFTNCGVKKNRKIHQVFTECLKFKEKYCHPSSGRKTRANEASLVMQC